MLFKIKQIKIGKKEDKVWGQARTCNKVFYTKTLAKQFSTRENCCGERSVKFVEVFRYDVKGAVSRSPALRAVRRTRTRTRGPVTSDGGRRCFTWSDLIAIQRCLVESIKDTSAGTCPEGCGPA